MSVRAIRKVGPLWYVSIRTDDGTVRSLVIPDRLATTESVAIAAHVVAMLTKRNQA